MKKILFLLMLLIPQVAFAIPQKGVEYTYQTIPGNPNDVLRLPDKVMIPLKPTGAVYKHKQEDAQGTKEIEVYVADPENEDLAEYKAWLKKGHKPSVFVAPPAPTGPTKAEVDELKEQIKQLKSQLDDSHN